MIEWEDRSNLGYAREDVSWRGVVSGRQLYRIENYFTSWGDSHRHIYTVLYNYEDDRLDFDSLEDAKQWCEMHYATGA